MRLLGGSNAARFVESPTSSRAYARNHSRLRHSRCLHVSISIWSKGHQRITDRVGLKLTRDVVMSAAVMEKVKERWPGTADLDDWENWSVEIVDARGQIVRTIALL